MNVFFRLLTSVVVVAQLAACGGGGGTELPSGNTGGGTVTAPAPVVAGFSVAPDRTSISVDGSTTALITATATDSSNRALAGIAVTFSTDTGVLVSPQSPTNANGEATVILKNGTANFANRIATVTAVAGAKTATTTVAMAGSTLTPDGISIGTNNVSILTDNSTSATITATVVDLNKNGLANIPVTFSTNSGQLSNATPVTNASGSATVVLTNGTSNFSNRTETVTATAGTKTASVPVLLTGSTLTLTASTNSASVGGVDVTFTATAKNSAPANTGVGNQTIRFSKGTGSTGDGTLSALTGTTGPSGIAPTVGGVAAPIRLTPTVAGTFIVVAEWLDAAGAVSTTASQTVTITPVGVAFAVTTPATSPSALALGSTQAFVVTVPTTINGTTVASVRFAASAGTWSNASAVSSKVPASNAVAETYTPSASAGTVTVAIDALNAANVPIGSLTQSLAVTAPAAAAASLNLQAAASTISPSAGTNLSTTTVTATVRDAANAAVGGAPVLFELLSTTGTGESISPAVAYTDSTGLAKATFTAGSLSTNGAIYVRASVIGAPSCTTTPPTVDPAATCKSVALLVNARAVSLTIGFSTNITDAGNGTLYKYPGSILVIDNNGSPVAGQPITLTLFPSNFRRGSVVVDPASATPTACVANYTTAILPNEDLNRNGILDPGEDVSGNGALTPPSAVGGAVPSSLTTDVTGIATFEITYPKSSGLFITDELTARVTVSGTEFASQTKVVLGISVPDSTPCALTGPRTFP